MLLSELVQWARHRTAIRDQASLQTSCMLGLERSSDMQDLPLTLLRGARRLTGMVCILGSWHCLHSVRHFIHFIHSIWLLPCDLRMMGLLGLGPRSQRHGCIFGVRGAGRGGRGHRSSRRGFHSSLHNWDVAVSA